MLRRYHATQALGDELPHAFARTSRQEGERLAVRLHGEGELFSLELPPEPGAPRIKSPFGQAQFSWQDLRTAWADPLWDSADGICAHMEHDHADTFATFLDMVGRPAAPEQPLSMPWVEVSGFFLDLAGEPVFIPFPQACPEPDLVRASMIKMLRSARANG